MSLKQNIIRTAVAAALVSIMSITGLADTIRLKDGSTIKGKITGFSGGKFTVAVGEGSRRRTMSFSADEVDSVEFDDALSNDAARTETISSDNPQRRTVPRVITTDNTATQPTPERKSPPVVVVTNAPANKPPVMVNTNTTPPPTAATQSENRPTGVKPIELTVAVLADDTANGWTNSGWIVRKGQRIKVIAEGEISLGNGQTTTPSGRYDLEDEGKLMPAVATGALLAVIGDDNNAFIYIGSEREFVAERDGALFLGINEDNLSDNKGSFSVRIEIYP